MICIYHFLPSINWDAITAIGTLGLFVSGIIIARKISFKRELNKRQLETVFEFVKELQNLKFHFNYLVADYPKIGDSHSGNIWYRFFDFNIEKIEVHKELSKEDLVLYISRDFLQGNQIFKFIHNPFLPKSISEKLIYLSARGGNQKEFAIERNQVFISDDSNFTEHIFLNERSVCYSSIKNFIASSQELRDSINTWLKKFDVDDLNVIDKHVNFKNYP